MLFFLLLLSLVLSQDDSNFDVVLRNLYENEMSCVVSLYNIDPLIIDHLQCTFKTKGKKINRRTENSYQTKDNKLITEQCELFTQENEENAILYSTIPKDSYLLQSVSINLYSGKRIVKEFFLDLDSVRYDK